MDLIEKARSAYKKAIGILDDMPRDLPAWDKPVLSREGFCKAFDLFLQYVLLEVALADGHLSAAEGLFVDTIGDYADASTLHPAYPAEITLWEKLAAEQELGELRTAVDAVGAQIKPLVAQCLRTWRAADVRSPRDYLAELRACIIRIIESFVCIDGECELSELDRSAAVLDDLLSRWAED